MPYKDPLKQKEAQHRWYLSHIQETRIRSNLSRRRSRQSREKKWKETFISCIRHLDRRCNRSRYIHSGSRRCATCGSKDAQGNYFPADRKFRQSQRRKEQQHWRRKSRRLELKIQEMKI